MVDTKQSDKDDLPEASPEEEAEADVPTTAEYVE